MEGIFKVQSRESILLEHCRLLYIRSNMSSSFGICVSL
jgi:hypothetical protein